ncbi:MAG: hypothetical protein HY007_00765 [Candidatus Sungbacteria bacterium]|nr:hypothetical protein [Candidatus Sungbacteria bacterium]
MNLSHVEPPHRLLGSILAHISREQRRHARMRLAVWTSGMAGAGAALAPAVRYAGQEFSRSGFYEYFSLLFSDGGVLLLNSWREFALLLAESLPLMSVTLVLAAVFVLLGSIRLMARDGRIAFLSVQLR